MHAPDGRVLLFSDTRQLQLEERFEVKVTAKSQEALAMASATAFDVVLIDLSLRDAAALGDRLRTVNAAAHTIWVVDEWSNEIAAKALEAGVLQVLDRNVDAQTIERVVTMALQRTRAGLATLRAIVWPTTTPRSVSATDAKNEFGAVLEAVARDGAVVITKHDAPKVVLVSVERVEQTLTKHEPDLAALSKHFDSLVERMRTPEARAASDALFTDDTALFGESALAAVKKPHG